MITKNLIEYYSRKYKNPWEVQKLLHSFSYNKLDTLSSAELTLQRQTAHCLEGVFVAAAILENYDYEPLVLSLESQDGLDHCLYVYQYNNRWGAVGKSRDKGLAGREPVFRNLKQLAWSYFDPYVDHSGKVTAWQVAHLDEVNVDWRRGKKNVWALENHLLQIPHHKIRASKRRYQKLLNLYKKGGYPPTQSHWW